MVPCDWLDQGNGRIQRALFCPQAMQHWDGWQVWSYPMQVNQSRLL